MSDPATAPDGHVHDGCQDHAMGGVVRADGMFGFEVVEDLGIAGTQTRGDKGVRASRGIVCRFGKRIVAFKADVMVSTFLKAHLERIIESTGRRIEGKGARD